MGPHDDRTYRTVIRIFRLVFRLLGLRLRVIGEHAVPSHGPAVLASNHLSYLDFAFVGLAGRRRRRLVRFMAKTAVFEHGVAGPLMRRMGHIPVDRASGAAAYRRAARELAAGELVGVFPEATISRSFTLKSFKLGAATLAVREQVPLIPVVLWAPQRTFTVDKQYSLTRGKTVLIVVGEPIVPGRDADPADVDAELRHRMDALLVEAWRAYPDQPRDDADRWWVPAVAGGSAPTVEVAADRERAAAERTARRVAERRAHG
ncbi:lysophospholipid acyltransferase family protein, partial [uncultured Jatrophihabitans sp.]|uniref:lysophospholipid acyltransferase family protein n=1 Tax=uncultured Jatrophihabitans sp. TaxID=1610747 RepID=UPI0035CB13E9